MPRSKRAMIVGAIITITSMLSILFGTAPAQAVGTPSQEQMTHAKMIADIFDEHNKRRAQNGLPALVFSPDISLRVSQPFTNTLAKTNNGTIWHNSSANIGQGGSTWGENVAGGYRAETASQLVDRWMNSSGHRTNILNKNYNTIAIGFAWADSGDWTFSTVNLYSKPTNPGVTYTSGAAWLASLGSGSGSSTVNVYLTPGTHYVNGRQWRTSCEPYSQTQRCTTEIWGTTVQQVGSRYVQSNGWVFNNLTYAPSPRSLWAGNPLGGNGVVGGKVSWVSDGRQWRTECDTAVTGNGGCRSYVQGTVIEKYGSGYRTVTTEIFNNMVLFS